MTINFTATAAGADEDPVEDYVSAGVAEHADGSGLALVFQCELTPPDEQDVELGLDTYCLVTGDEATVYGGITEAVLRDGVLRIVLGQAAQQELGLAEPDIEVTLDVPGQAVEALRGGLRRILATGRPSERPAVLCL